MKHIPFYTVLEYIFEYICFVENNPLVKIYTLATSGNDHVIKLWQITYQITPKHLGELGEINIEQINELEGHESAITCVKYSANSVLLASTSLDKSIKLWNTDGECLSTQEIHTRYVNCIVFSRDTTILASGIRCQNNPVNKITFIN